MPSMPPTERLLGPSVGTLRILRCGQAFESNIHLTKFTRDTTNRGSKSHAFWA